VRTRYCRPARKFSTANWTKCSGAGTRDFARSPKPTSRTRRWLDPGLLLLSFVRGSRLPRDALRDCLKGSNSVTVGAATPRNDTDGVNVAGVKGAWLKARKVVVVHPDDATEAAFAAVGGNLLDPFGPRERCSRRPERGRPVAII
jgi:hypothetical protein